MGSLSMKPRKTPSITVDALVVEDGFLLLVKRKNPPHGWALPGGFVDYGEAVETAVVREVEEETGLAVRIRNQFHVYSDPARDPRRHTITVVFDCKRIGGELLAGDDAAEAAFFPLSDLPEPICFDHARIIEDWLVISDGMRPEVRFHSV